MKSSGANQDQRTEERHVSSEEKLKEFSEHVERLPQIAQIAVFAAIQATLMDTSLGEKMYEILWPHVQGSALLEQPETEKGYWLDFGIMRAGDKPEDTPEAAAMRATEPDESKAEEDEAEEDFCLTDETRQRLLRFYKRVERRTKLAILALTEIRYLEGINFDQGTPRGEKLVDRIDADLEESCLQKFDDPELQWLAGVWQSAQMISQCT